MSVKKNLCAALSAALALALFGTAQAATPNRAPGSVIFFHPDGTGPNHWGAARLYFKGLDGSLNWDRLPAMAAYRGHMANVITGTSNGGATTHAFGYKVDGLGSFGMDGDRDLARSILSLSGYQGALMREAANNNFPVGVVNDGHIGEPGTAVFLTEVGNRDNWQEITRQMIQGRPGMNDATPWVIMGGGEADTLPAGATLLHRNVNQERGAPVNSRASLRTDNLDLQAEWNAKGSGNLSNNPLQNDDYIVVRTRAEFERLKLALQNTNYAPHVLGLFAFQDTFNDRNEQDLINRGFVRPEMAPGQIGPAPTKQSRLVLWGDFNPAEPGYNPPTFAEMTEVAIDILDRAARMQRRPDPRRFFLVAEQESNDNFGNNNNAVGTLHAMRDSDNAIGVALRYLAQRPRTLILTAADSDAGGMQVGSPNKLGALPATNVVTSEQTPDAAITLNTNPSSIPLSGLIPDSTPVANFADGVEGRQSPMFLTEPDQFGNRMQFGIMWLGTPDFSGGIVSRAAGHNANLLNRQFSERFDNVDVYRMMHLTLFGGQMLQYPTERAPAR